VTGSIEHAVFRVASVLLVPVLILALAALAVVLFELGTFAVELVRRRRRSFARLQLASDETRAAITRGDVPAAHRALEGVAWSSAMGAALSFLVAQARERRAGERMAKGLADFDLGSLRRLERTRMLVRVGPALGLMGTLIPLSPALAGLASGNVKSLSDNLRVAFSVTVLGLLVGAIAFALSLVRDRLYSQDLSDLEYVAATIAPDEAVVSAGGT
jgi:biopolymer transport protein ExbB/TolQ